MAAAGFFCSIGLAAGAVALSYAMVLATGAALLVMACIRSEAACEEF